MAVVAIGVAAFALTRDDGNSSSTIATRDIAATQQVRQACQQWFDSSTTDTTPGRSGWCGYMSDWMYDHMGSGQMMGPMMWGDPTAMYDTCVQAMGSYQPSVDDPAQWCQNMVDWMSQNMGSWMDDCWHDGDDGDWDGMMNPSMMGR